MRRRSITAPMSRKERIRQTKSLERQKVLMTHLEQKASQTEMSFQHMEMLTEAINTSVIETLKGLEDWVVALKDSGKSGDDILSSLEKKIKSASDQLLDIQNSGGVAGDIMSGMAAEFDDIQKSAKQTIGLLSSSKPAVLEQEIKQTITPSDLTPNTDALDDMLKEIRTIGVELDVNDPEIPSISTSVPANKITEIIKDDVAGEQITDSNKQFEIDSSVIQFLDKLTELKSNLKPNLKSENEKLNTKLPGEVSQAGLFELPETYSDKLKNDFADITEIIKESISDISTGILDNVTEASDKTKAIISDVKSISDNILSEQLDLTSIYADGNIQLKEASELLIEESKTNKENLDILTKQLELLNDLTDGKLTNFGLLQDEADIYKKTITQKRDELIFQKAIIDNEQKKITVISKYASIYKDTFSEISSGIGNIQSTVENLLEDLPGGNWIAKRLNISGIRDEFDKFANKGFSDFMSAVKTDGVGAFKALGKAGIGMGRSIVVALGPIGIALGIVTALVLALKHVTGQLKDISTENGISLDKSKEVLATSYKIQESEHNRLSTHEDILQAMHAMKESMGDTMEISQAAVAGVSDIGKAMGIGIENAAKFHSVLKKVGASDEAAVKMELLALKAGEAAGFSSKMITDDLVDNADQLAEYFFGYPEKMLKTVIGARQLGLSVDKLVKISDSLLDMESSITAQFEASAVLGKNINMQKAREAALNDDLLGMAEEITKQVGSSADLARMSRVERKLLAKTIGLEVSELTKMVSFEEKSAAFSKDKKELASKYLDKMGDISALSQEEYESMLGQMTVQDEMNAKWGKIKSQFSQALLPLAEGFANLLSGLMPILDPVVEVLKVIGKVLGFIGKIIGGIMAPFKLIGTAVKSIFAIFDKSTTVVGEMNAGVADLKGSFSGVASVIGVILGLLSAPRMFSKLIGGIKSILGLSRGVGKGGVLSTIVGELPTITPKRGILKGISAFIWKQGKDIIGSGLKLGAELGMKFAVGLSKNLPNIGNVFKGIFTSSGQLMSKFFGLFKGEIFNIKKLLNFIPSIKISGLLNTLKSFGKSAIGILATVGSSISNIFNSIKMPKLNQPVDLKLAKSIASKSVGGGNIVSEAAAPARKSLAPEMPIKNKPVVSKVLLDVKPAEKTSTSLIKNIGNKLSGLGSKLSTGISSVLPKISGIFSGLIKGFGTKILRVGSMLLSGVSSILPKAIKLLGGITKGILPKLIGIGSVLLSSISGVLPQIGKIIAGIGSRIKNVLSGFKLPKLAIPKLAAPKTAAAVGKGALGAMPKAGGILGKGVAAIAGRGAAKAGAKGLAKVGGKSLLKGIVKKIPILGAIAGAGFAIDRLMKGDYLGAGGELASGLASIIPGIGTAASVGIDAALMVRDIKKQNKMAENKPVGLDESALPDMPTGMTDFGAAPGEAKVPAIEKEKETILKETERVTDNKQPVPPKPENIFENITNNYSSSTVAPMPPVSMAIPKTVAAEVESQPVQVNVPKQDTVPQQQISTQKIEQLLLQTVQLLNSIASKENTVVLTDQGLNTINNKLKAKNAG